MENLMTVLDQYPEACRCEKCCRDIAILALNNLPAKYAATEKGDTYTRLTETFVSREMNAVKESAATAQEGEYILSLLPLSVNTLVLEGALQTGINVDSNSDSDFHIFPNPANDVLHVQSKKPALLRILSMQGNCLATQNINEPGNHTFSIADYPKGTYILSALDRWGNQTTKKFIIK
jgi:competence protein ComFB